MIHPTELNNIQKLIDSANVRLDMPISMNLIGTRESPKIEIIQEGHVLFNNDDENIGTVLSTYLDGVLTGLRLNDWNKK